MQAQRRPHPSRAAFALAGDDSPSRYWGLALVAGCAASWAAIFAAAKLLVVCL